MNNLSPFLTVSSILFGFLFAGFWWSLNRELVFDETQRHFKFGYLLLMMTMALLAYFGIILPLRLLVSATPGLLWAYRGVVLAIVGVFGYMLTEFAHYRIFQKPKYVTPAEWVAFPLALLILLGMILRWRFLF